MSDFPVARFANLFAGRADAFGTGRGEWVRRRLVLADYEDHLRGVGHGLGIAPLNDAGKIKFAAIDLDDSSLESYVACKEMQRFLGFTTTFIERSRSGNYHLWCFFADPIDAWVVRGVLKEAIQGAGLPPQVEVFPKQDRLREGMVGNYINLPYFGDTRPILRPVDEVEDFEDSWHPDLQAAREAEAKNYSVYEFCDAAWPPPPTAPWHKRAQWLMIEPPEARKTTSVEFGTAPNLHQCAEYIILHRHEHPIREGHRNVVYFNLAKMLSHYSMFDHDEAWEMMRKVRDASDEEGVTHVSDHELHRLLSNAEQGQYTSTGCDDPLMQPYVDPECPIARNG